MIRILSFLGGLLLFVVFAGPVVAQEKPREQSRAYYLYEVSNQLQLSDFEMGSTETIKDQDGNGLGFSFIVKKGQRITLALDMGYSKTVYRGAIEDAVSVSFEPQSGTDYEALSSSTNVTYDFDMTFSNPYVGLNVLFDHFMIGGGRLMQSAEGNVVLSSQGIQLVEATYEPGNQLYWQGGFLLNLDDLFIAILARGYEAPALKILSCNEAAVGATTCARIEGATGNRNARSTTFGEGVLRFGLLF